MRKVKILCVLLTVIVSFTGILSCGKKQEKITLSSTSGDDQPYWNIFNHSVAKAENGYYYLDKYVGDELFYIPIYYMDAETGESIILCGKADCNHNNAECNAILNSFDGYNTQQLYYHNEMLYVIYDDESSGLSYLEQIAPDGSYRKRLFEIGEILPAYCLVFHDDSVYIYQRQGGVSGYEENTATIRRRSLDGEEDEYVYEYTGQGAVIYAAKSYGDKLFFIVEEEPRVSTEEHSERTYERKGICAYDYNTKQVTQVCREAVCDYTIDVNNNTIYYYVFNDGLYKRKLSDSRAEKIYSMKDGETNICQVSFDGTYVYLSNEQYYVFFYQKTDFYLYVLDTDGNELNRIATPGMYCTSFGDDKYVFCKESMGNASFRYIKKSDILTAKEWTDCE